MIKAFANAVPVSVVLIGVNQIGQGPWPNWLFTKLQIFELFGKVEAAAAVARVSMRQIFACR